MLAWFPVLWIVVLVNSAELPSRYHNLRGHQVWHVSGDTTNDVVQGLESEGFVDVLDHSRSRRSLRIAPEHQEYVHNALKEKGMGYKIHIEELLSFFEDKESAEQDSRASRSSGDVKAQECTSQSCPQPLTEDYMTLEQMEWYISEIAKTYSDRVNVTSIGKSVEGRNIWLVHVKAGDCTRGKKDRRSRIGKRMAWLAKSKKTLWIEGGLHAREWISPAVALKVIDRFLKDCSVSRTNELYIVPMSNPDGYKYTWTHNRLWRKNRAVIPGSSCIGVDLNRNWDYHWGVGASSSPCSETYKGPSGFSEPETRALRDAMKNINKVKTKKKKGNKIKRAKSNKKKRSQKYSDPSVDFELVERDRRNKDKRLNKRRKRKKENKKKPKNRNQKAGNIDLVLSLHSYGQVLMYPWGWTSDPAPDTEKMKKMGDIFAGAARERQGSVYDVVNSAGGFYYASGATDDWAKGELNTPYVYTLELRDTGHHGFQLPRDQINDTGNEVWDGIRRFLTALNPTRMG